MLFEHPATQTSAAVMKKMIHVLNFNIEHKHKKNVQTIMANDLVKPES